MQNRPEFGTWYERFNRFAGDLYPHRYTRDYVTDLVEIGHEVLSLAREKNSLIVAHNYQYPELQEVAEEVGDSLGLSQYVASRESERVDFCGVWFMGETAKNDRRGSFESVHAGRTRLFACGVDRTFAH